jgi:hypothetical protein
LNGILGAVCASLNCVDLIRRETLKKLYKLSVISTVMLSAAAFAMTGYREDVSAGSSISNGLHKTAAAPAGRAEWRCNPSENSACSKRSGTINFSGEFKVNGGANISVAQFLNVTGNDTSGPSKPVSQLVVDGQSNNSYRVSIEQGDHNCGFRVTKGVWNSFSASITKGGAGAFTINGKFCQRPPSTNKAGLTNNNVYYFKYGAYNAASNSTASSVSWR